MNKEQIDRHACKVLYAQGDAHWSGINNLIGSQKDICKTHTLYKHTQVYMLVHVCYTLPPNREVVSLLALSSLFRGFTLVARALAFLYAYRQEALQYFAFTCLLPPLRRRVIAPESEQWYHTAYCRDRCALYANMVDWEAIESNDQVDAQGWEDQKHLSRS